MAGEIRTSGLMRGRATALPTLPSLRETSPFSIFSRQDAKAAKVFDPGARGPVIYWMLHVSGTIVSILLSPQIIPSK